MSPAPTSPSGVLGLVGRACWSLCSECRAWGWSSVGEGAGRGGVGAGLGEAAGGAGPGGEQGLGADPTQRPFCIISLAGF